MKRRIFISAALLSPIVASVGAFQSGGAFKVGGSRWPIEERRSYNTLIDLDNTDHMPKTGILRISCGDEWLRVPYEIRNGKVFANLPATVDFMIFE